MFIAAGTADEEALRPRSQSRSRLKRFDCRKYVPQSTWQRIRSKTRECVYVGVGMSRVATTSTLPSLPSHEEEDSGTNKLTTVVCALRTKNISAHLNVRGRARTFWQKKKEGW